MGDGMKITVLFSGGLDSTVCLFQAFWSSCEHDVTALLVDYNQPHVRELECAKSICNNTGIKWIAVNAYPWVRSPAGNKPNHVPWSAAEGDPMVIRGRNSLFVALACAATDPDQVWLGCNHNDQADYEDFRTPWAERMTQAFRVDVVLPLCLYEKWQIVKMARWYDINIGDTLSCYRGLIPGCGECNACVLRDEAIRHSQDIAT